MSRIRRNGTICLLLAGVAVVTAGRAAAQTSPISVAEAKRQGVALATDTQGPSVVLQGVITEAPLSLSPKVKIAYVEDATGGIRLFSRKADWPGVVDLQVGDVVLVTGALRQYQRALEVSVETTSRVGHGPPPSPRALTTADLRSGRHNGLLVELHGVIAASKDPSVPVTSVVLHDDFGEISVTIPSRFYLDRNFASRVAKGGEVSIAGIADADESDPPRFIPRVPSDITFSSQSRATVAIGVLIVVLAGTSTYLWIGRRRTERKASALATLSQRLQASEEAMRRSEASVRSLVNNATCGIYRSTFDGRFLDVNSALVDMLGYESPEALTRLNISELFVDPTERNRLVEAWRHSAGPCAADVMWKRKDGTQIEVQLRGRVVQSGPEPTFEMIAEDVTTRRRLEDQLRRTERLNSLGQLAGGIAHDFNNLLTAILGCTELALEQVDQGQPIRDDIEEIKKAAERAATLTRQLLAFSRRQVLVPKPLRVDGLLENLVPMLRRLIGESVRLTVSSEASLGTIKADPGQIEQVIVNLVVNARDAMPDGGTVTITAANVDLDAPCPFREVTVPSGAYVRVRVTDTGVGMDLTTQQHIFEPFFTTKASGKGTGLGLSTAFGVVEQSGGYLVVESALGQGTTFQMFFPRTADTVDALPEMRSPSPVALRSGTILVVEDEDLVRALAKRMLERQGYTVLCAAGLDEAVAHCRRHAGPIQLLLTDVVLPRSNGREIASIVCKLRPSIRVLFMSGYTDDQLLRHGIASEDTACIQKPFTSETLLAKVGSVFAELDDTQAADSPASAEQVVDDDASATRQ